MDKAITTSLFIAVGIMMALMLFNVAYPAAIEGSDAIASMSYRMTERMRTQIMVIHAVGELDSDGTWQDINGNGLFDVTIWVKNVGQTRINPIDAIDVFFGPEGNFGRVPNTAFADGNYPRWTGTVEGGTDWQPSGTLRINIQQPSPLASDRYYIKVSLPNGVSHEYFVGI